MHKRTLPHRILFAATHLNVKRRFAGVPGLSHPEDCERLARETCDAAEALVTRVVSRNGSGNTLSLLDQLSSTMCAIMDALELARNVHPSRHRKSLNPSAYHPIHRPCQCPNRLTRNPHA